MTAASYTQSQKSVLTLYALIGAGTALCLLPFSLLPFAGLACLLVGFVATYIYRARNKEDEVMAFHTTYLIRTMWWSTLILFVGIALFACIIVYNGDLSSIHQLMADAEKGIVPTESDVQLMQLTFVKANASLITLSALVCLLPYPIYLVVRIFKGVRMIKKRAET